MSHSIRVAFLVLCAVAFSFAPKPCFAETSEVPRAQAVSEPVLQSPEGKFIQDLGDKATGVLVDTGLSSAQLDSKFHEMLNSAFDVETIGVFVIGHTWTRLSQDQRQEYQKVFKEFLLRNYGARLRSYNGEKLKLTRARSQGHASVVSSEISRSFGLPTTYIDWVVRHQSDGKLAVVDVVVDGVSQSVTQREEFASILAHNGGDFNTLLDALRERVQQASAEKVQVE
jgi:phospholipid transport system substrate-binding protein